VNPLLRGSEGADLSFSADTGMAECLVVGRKRKPRQKSVETKEINRATFIVLNERPAFPLLGYGTARQIRQLIAAKNIRSLEKGPVGGTLLRFGNDVVGHAVEAALPEGWNLSRVADIPWRKPRTSSRHRDASGCRGCINRRLLIFLSPRRRLSVKPARFTGT
jgi:hypothetical protein